MALKNKWIFILTALILAGCTVLGGGAEPTAEAQSLANTSWMLVSYGPADAPTEVAPGSQVTLQFEGETNAGGSAGCNSYGGQYQQQGSTVSFNEVVSTLMACADAAVMEQETQFLTALQTTGEFELSGDSLTIFYNNGQDALNFNRAPAQ